jgi:hypothetical protein
MQVGAGQDAVVLNHGEGLKCMDLNSRISVVLSSEGMAHSVTPGLFLEECQVIEPQSECCCIEMTENSVSFSLEEMFNFDVTMQNLARRQANRVLVCTGFDTNRQARTLMLLGCHMVISQGMGFEETFLIFRPMQSTLKTHLIGISAFEVLLRAICCAKCLNWINFGLDSNNRPANCVQMDEFIHYARSDQTDPIQTFPVRPTMHISMPI